MTLNAQGKIQNVKASLEKYISENLQVKEGFTMDYEGVPFESAGNNEWIQERILSFGKKDFRRQTSSTGLRGYLTLIMLSFNIFVDSENTLRTNRIYEIRDTIMDYFKEGTKISLYDFSTGEWNTILDSLIVRGIETDSPIPNDDLSQYNVTVGIDWLEQTN